MATVYSDIYQTSSVTYTRVRVDYSGTTATAYLLYSRTNSYSGATHQADTFTFGGQSVWFDQTFYGEQYDTIVCSVTFNISSSGGVYSGYTNGTGYGVYYIGFSGSVTIPAQEIVPRIVQRIAKQTSSNTAELFFTTAVDSGLYDKNIQWSLDNSTWHNGETVSTSSAYNGSFRIKNLTPNQINTVYLRIDTTGGVKDGTYFTVDMKDIDVLHAGVNNKTHAIGKLYGEVGGEATSMDKLYASVGGEAKLVFKR